MIIYNPRYSNEEEKIISNSRSHFHLRIVHSQKRHTNFPSTFINYLSFLQVHGMSIIYSAGFGLILKIVFLWTFCAKLAVQSANEFTGYFVKKPLRSPKFFPHIHSPWSKETTSLKDEKCVSQIRWTKESNVLVLVLTMINM